MEARGEIGIPFAFEKSVLSLGRLDEAGHREAGFKALNLGALSREPGYRVPPGFCVTTSAYGSLLEANRLRPKIESLLHGLDYDDFEAVRTVSVKIRDLFEGASMPASETEAVLAAYRELCGGAEESAVAVRSSATCEDLPSASFAGQYDTYLNVRGEEALVVAVKRCMGSLWSSRAILYRYRNLIDGLRAEMAVIVQRMIVPQVSGVLFTGSLDRSGPDAILINACFGLGEGIVNGTLNSDVYRVDRSCGEILSAEIREKDLMYRCRPGGGTALEKVREEARAAGAMTASQVRELAALARSVESFLSLSRNLPGVPVDIEWALAHGDFHILQARPMLLPPSVREGLPEGVRLRHPWQRRLFRSVSLLAEGEPEAFRTLCGALLGDRLRLEELGEILLPLRKVREKARSAPDLREHWNNIARAVVLAADFGDDTGGVLAGLSALAERMKSEGLGDLRADLLRKFASSPSPRPSFAEIRSTVLPFLRNASARDATLAGAAESWLLAHLGGGGEKLGLAQILSGLLAMEAAGDIPRLRDALRTRVLEALEGEGGIRPANFGEIGEIFPLIWERADRKMRPAARRALRRILETGEGFGGTDFADILHHGLRLLERASRLPFLEKGLVRERILRALETGEGFREVGYLSVHMSALGLMEKSPAHPWIEAPLRDRITRILRSGRGMAPGTFEDLSRYAFPLLSNTEHPWIREPARESILTTLKNRGISSHLEDFHLGLGLIGRWDPEMDGALIECLTFLAGERALYDVSRASNEEIIPSVLEPTVHRVLDLGNQDLEMAFFRNAPSILEGALRGVDADDSLEALHRILVRAAGYSPRRNLRLCRRALIENVYKRLPGVFLIGADWRTLHDDFEDIVEECPAELRGLARDLRDGYHNAIDPENLEMARRLLSALRKDFPDRRRAIALSEGIESWLAKAYSPVISQIEDIAKLEGLWPPPLREKLSGWIGQYRRFRESYAGGEAVEAVLSYAYLRMRIDKLLTTREVELTPEERLTLFLTDINLERLEPGLSSVLDRRFDRVRDGSDLAEVCRWAYSLLLTASVQVEELAGGSTLDEMRRFTRLVEKRVSEEARDLWGSVKLAIHRIRESRDIVPLILFDTPAEKIDDVVYEIVPISPGAAEGYLRIFERKSGEDLMKELNHPERGVREGEIVVLDYLPQIIYLRTLPEAIVVEMGSVGSHTAKVAAEFSIPALKLRGACGKLEPGARYRVSVSENLDHAEIKPVEYKRMLTADVRMDAFYPGKCEGVLRIVADPERIPSLVGDLGPYEIIVAPYLGANLFSLPRSWTPAGIILERGSELTNPGLFTMRTRSRRKDPLPIFRMDRACELLRDGTPARIEIPPDRSRVGFALKAERLA